MINIVLPDGAVKTYPTPVTGLAIAQDISIGLSKAAIAIKVNDQLKDLTDIIDENAQISIITLNDAEGIDIMRHTITAQLLARAIKNLYPDAKLAIGPTIKDGFYYDVSLTTPLSLNDLEAIEKEMVKIAQAGHKIIKKILSREEAIALFKERGEEYKIKIIESTSDQHFQIYFQGETGFIDLCRGPHLPSLTQVGAFKLTKLAGAYWRGDSHNEMLTRIYGTAWKNAKDLKIYLQRIEEAEKRDHRKISQMMDLLHFQSEAPGQVFWHDKGWTMFKELENYIREKLKSRGYQEVNTPKIINKDLFVKSGHWEKFGTDEMFITEAYGHLHALKPMNCPCHVQIYNHSLKSYRDLPIKMSEFGNCLRQEPRGALHGLMRVTSMTQDDAHIFCTVDQIKEQVLELNELISEIYTELGFKDFFVRFSDRPEQRVGDDAIWDQAEQALLEASKEAGIECELNKGDGAFYGPKLEFVLTDAIGREWQCGTIQLDFNLPRRLEATYTDAHGEKQYPVMIHRALLGSMERFLGMYIEHYAGNFPVWISPLQLVITGVSEKHNEFAKKLTDYFKQSGIRVILDARNEKISYKIREHLLAKASYIGIVGDKEMEQNTITVRSLGSNKQETFKVEDFLSFICEEIKDKKLPMST
ncbi:MAG: threonyl-tRNA synthetase [Francisellaceae bacterium]|nr:threonyl-tRNA synthetase [Francisellaceae bacterium]